MGDVRAAFRMVRTQPGLAVAIVLTLAIALSATSAIFSLVHALLFRPLPFPDAERLVTIDARLGVDAGRMTLREFRDLSRGATLFERWGAYYLSQYNVTDGGPPESLTCTIASSTVFRTLGVAPLLGDLWTEAQDFTRQSLVALSHRVWQQRFGSRLDVIGRTITMDGARYQVAAVLPAAFDYPLRTDVYRAVTDYNAAHVRHYSVIARLRRGVAMADAQAELDGFADRFARAYPDTNRGVSLRLTPLRDASVGSARPFLWLLLVASSLLLVIAAVNVTNLLLSRSIATSGQAAVRLALGASRWQLVRQSVIEAACLATVGSLLAAVTARWLLRALATMVSVDLPPWFDVQFDGWTLVAAVAGAWLVAVAVSVLPGLHMARSDVERILRQEALRSVESPRQRLARRALLFGQAAFATLLLVAAGSFLQALRDRLAVDPGFVTSNVLTFRVDPPFVRYPDIARTSEYYRRAAESLAAIPGVLHVATTSTLPLSGIAPQSRRLTIDDRSSGRAEEEPFATVHLISPEYFRAMGIRVVKGRAFAWIDQESAPPVAIVSERTARRLWANEDPLGRRVGMLWNQHGLSSGGGIEMWLTVVGVARDVRGLGLDDTSSLDVYAPNMQLFSGDAYVVIRTATDPAAIQRSLRSALDRVDPEQSYFESQTMDDRLRAAAWQQRVASVVLTALAGIALCLAVVGAYAVTAHGVASQGCEIAVRLALGSSAGQTGRLILRRALVPVVTGSAVGVVGGLLVARILAPMVGFAADSALALPATLPLVLVGAAASACAVPILRTVCRVTVADVLRSR
jgi:putative ABC transport system permease protein